MGVADYCIHRYGDPHRPRHDFVHWSVKKRASRQYDEGLIYAPYYNIYIINIYAKVMNKNA